ncbi:hypothetical protein EZV62_003654 [Acer yangbiense]|uniref:SLC26A/SulP transporter domain-containing protein n=1 Tax=Acer yangbiense TaxID=1000413 RepID=A0A5C7II19_9ROSI|nr:hypothetical protein EZV62_003654 [Acer yangbiense]
MRLERDLESRCLVWSTHSLPFHRSSIGDSITAVNSEPPPPSKVEGRERKSCFSENCPARSVKLSDAGTSSPYADVSGDMHTEHISAICLRVRLPAQFIIVVLQGLVLLGDRLTTLLLLSDSKASPGSCRFKVNAGLATSFLISCCLNLSSAFLPNTTLMGMSLIRCNLQPFKPIATGMTSYRLFVQTKDPLLFLQLAFTSTFFAGLFQASLGFLRLGFIIDFLSKATLIGFMAGVAIIVSLQQLKALLFSLLFSTTLRGKVYDPEVNTWVEMPVGMGGGWLVREAGTKLSVTVEGELYALDPSTAHDSAKSKDTWKIA